MRFHSISPTAVLLLFGTLASVGNCNGRENDQVVAALLHLGPAATSFCSSFLCIPKKTITAATVTPVVTATAVITTTTMIRVDKRAPVVPGKPSCPVFGLPCVNTKRNINRPLPPGLGPFREELISIGCSLLRITPAVTTVTATLAPITTTTTTTTTLITTVKRGICDADASHNVSGNGTGNSVNFIAGPTTSLACCQLCQTTTNCVGNAFTAGACQFLTKVAPLSGAPTSGTCPLGIETYPFGPSTTGALVFKGPCGM